MFLPLKFSYAQLTAIIAFKATQLLIKTNADQELPSGEGKKTNTKTCQTKEQSGDWDWDWD